MKPQVEFDPMQGSFPVEEKPAKNPTPKPGPSASKKSGKKGPSRKAGATPKSQDMRLGLLKC